MQQSCMRKFADVSLRERLLHSSWSQTSVTEWVALDFQTSQQPLHSNTPAERT